MKMKFTRYFLFIFLVLPISLVFAQEKTVTGTVTDSKGMPLPGVNVVQKNSNNGTVTDFDGNYSLTLSGDAILEFSFLGFTSQEVNAQGQTRIDVSLEEDAAQLDEVVVVGYGSQKRTNVTSSVSTVDMEETLGERPVSSTSQLLQGTSPGLQVVTGTGRPGESSGINIRGITSINGGSPLILVDNAEVPSLDDINPNDIQSVSVLKDAAAAAIYGARGAFGVVLITTKKGKKNTKPKITLSSRSALTYGMDLPSKLNIYDSAHLYQDWEIDNVNGRDVDTWVNYLEDYKANPDAYPEGFVTAENGQTYEFKDGPEWWDLAFNTGFEQIYNVSYSGGSESTTYRLSLGYNDQDGILITDKDSYKKYNLNAFMSTDLTDNLTMSTNIFYKNDLQKIPNQLYYVFGYGVLYGPWAKSGFSDNAQTGESIPYATPNNFLPGEPAEKNYGDDIRLNGKLEWRPFEDFTFTTDYTFNKTSDYNKKIQTGGQYMNPTSTEFVNFGNVSSFYKWNRVVNYHALNLRANYEKNFGDHHFGGLLGANYEKSDMESFSSFKDELINNNVPSLSTAIGTPSVGDGYYEWGIAGYFGRLNYNYKEKYLLELVGRYDGSSRFAAGDRFVFLPSASAGWVVSKEPFMEALKPTLSYLKLRGSYGEIGNQRVTFPGTNTQNYYPYQPTFPTGNSEWIDQSGVRYVTLYAPQLVSAGFTWETVRTLDVGGEIALFNNRLSSTFDWYRRETLGMLDSALELPTVLGADAPLQNVADLETKGWELELKWQDKIGDDFSYSIGGNLYDSRAYITNIEIQSGNIYDYYVGKEIGELWGYQGAGFYNVDDFEEGVPGNFNDTFTLKDGVAPFDTRSMVPGDVRFQDLNGDGVVDDGMNTLEDHGDLKRIGNNQRRYQYGITGSARYKGFSLSFFLQGVGKRQRNIYTPVTFPRINTFTAGILTGTTDAWTPDNQDAFYPRIASRNYDLAGQANSQYLFDVSYLNIKNVTLGYDLPPKFLEALHLSQLRLSISGENLYMFDDLPEGVQSDLQAESGGAGYPLLRKFSLGVDISL